MITFLSFLLGVVTLSAISWSSGFTACFLEGQQYSNKPAATRISTITPTIIVGVIEEESPLFSVIDWLVDEAKLQVEAVLAFLDSTMAQLKSSSPTIVIMESLYEYFFERNHFLDRLEVLDLSKVLIPVQKKSCYCK